MNVNSVKINEIPRHYTPYRDENGALSIREVRFHHIYVKPMVMGNDKRADEQEYAYIIYSLAGIEDKFIAEGHNVVSHKAFGDFCGMKKREVTKIYSSKEKAIESVRKDPMFANYPEQEFSPRLIKRASFFSKPCFLWWENLPSNITIFMYKVNEVMTEYRAIGWAWDGTKPVKYHPKTKYSNFFCKMFKGDGQTHIDGSYFDLVSRSWTPFDKVYYASEKECEENNQLQIFEFED